MLSRLRISNIAVVDEVELKFGKGLNVITGETGAGKSILIGAIGLALGDRVNPEVQGHGGAKVETEFDDVSAKCLLRREIRPDGRTKAWIDGEHATIASLKEEASRWVDLTAQREGATLLDPDTHLRHLDRFAGLRKEAAELETMYAQWQALTSRIASVKASIQRHRETDELAKFQLEEIERFDPKPGEDDELEQEIRLLEGAERLIIGLDSAVDSLDQSDEAISDRLAEVVARLRELARIDDTLSERVDGLENTLDLLRDISRQLASRRDEVQLDPERLESVRNRYDQLHKLIRKYGGSLGAMLRMFEDLRRRESGIEGLEEELTRLDRDLDAHLRRWGKELEEVSARRGEAAPRMAAEMVKGLRAVGVERPQFELVWVEEAGEKIAFPSAGEHRTGPKGWDQLEFRITFNPGQPLKPLQQVASGGEISRVLLLLKGLTPPETTPPVLIFDEIDTGISGRTARQVGLRLKQLAEKRQVLLVTHLAQIASLADVHWVVEKIQKKDRTFVRVKEMKVGGREQIDEIARLVGGEKITESARVTARELIANSEQKE